MKIRSEHPLPADVYTTLKQSPMYWPAQSRQRIKDAIWAPRNTEAEHADRPRIFVTGHMIDQNPQKDRFPDNTEKILEVRNALWQKLDELYAASPEKGIELVMCSATAGTDLLATEWAMIKMNEAQNRGELPKVSMDVNLPFEESAFLSEAVNHASEENYPWQAIYDHAKDLGFIHEPRWKLSAAGVYVRREDDHSDRLVVIPFTRVEKDTLTQVYKSKHQESWQSFVDLNMHMTSRLRQGDYMIAVWDGKGGITPGGTQHGLTMAEPIIGLDNIFVLQSGINQTGTDEQYGEFARRKQYPVGDETLFEQLHKEAMERWAHSRALQRRGR